MSKNMPKRVVIIQGHPDPQGGHFCHALAGAYEQSARAAGHEVKNIPVAKLDFPVLRTKEDWDRDSPLPEVRQAQQDILWAGHLVIIYPLWLGAMPALLKAFFEQVFRPSLVSEPGRRGDIFSKPLKGRTAHIVITMGMPALAYRWYFGAHSLKSFERNVLRFVGIKPVRDSLIGMVEGTASRHQHWLARMQAFGERAA
jgi:putative NADPH-quinone reductase